MAVEQVTMATEPDGRSLLRIRFACSTQADWSQTDLKRLCLYLAAEAPVSSALHLMLTKRQAALYLRLPGQTDRIRLDAWFSLAALRMRTACGPKATAPSAATSCCWNILPSGKSLCSFT